MDLEFNVFGVKELEQVFEALPDRMQKTVLTTALRGGGSTLVKAARANISGDNIIRTGLLRKAMSLRLKRYSRQGVIWVGVGASRSVVGTLPSGKRIVPANYDHLVEYGTYRSRARPFLRPAFDNNKSAIFNGITKRAQKGLAREIAKLRKATR